MGDGAPFREITGWPRCSYTVFQLARRPRVPPAQTPSERRQPNKCACVYQMHREVLLAFYPLQEKVLPALALNGYRAHHQSHAKKSLRNKKKKRRRRVGEWGGVGGLPLNYSCLPSADNTVLNQPPQPSHPPFSLTSNRTSDLLP